ncbi:MAG TPA: OsmC family protein [Kineosporiaceae bacterium]|nr:OsmC family protein [Kineosporiaceae bacterium]
MKPIRVDHVDGDTFTIGVREHQITVDQPLEDGGTDAGPTPTELFVAALAGCVAYYARRYLARHGLPERGLQVAAEYTMGTRPARVAQIHIRLVIPDGVPIERRDPLLAVATRCTVHNSLAIPPEVSIAVETAPDSLVSS